MITKQQSDFLKLIALCAMVLDHIGFYLLPELVELRAIGRIAFPIFAYQLTIGYSMTSSKKDYFYRLIIVGLVSQIPHYFLSNELYLNILFTLALGVLALYSIDKKKYYYLFDSTRLYVLIPDSISKFNPEFIYEDSKGYPFLSLNDEKVEIDIDTTNSLYMVNDTKNLTNENKAITTKNKKVIKSKVKKRTKSTTKSKK